MMFRCALKTISNRYRRDPDKKGRRKNKRRRKRYSEWKAFNHEDMGDCFGFQLYFMGKPLDMRKKPQPRIGMSRVPIFTQSTLSKADTLGIKATVRFREVSALERVQLQRYKCNSAGSGPNLLSGLESVRLERVDCSDIAEIRTIVTSVWQGRRGGGGGGDGLTCWRRTSHHIRVR